MPDRSVAPRPDVNRWIIAISVMFGTFMEVLDTTVVNVSLPHIAGNLSVTTDEATWALTSYLVANAIILPITGWLANQFGRRRLIMMAVAGFTSTSLLCGLAPSLSMLIVFRLLQGATGGALQPLSQAVMLEAFPPEERGKAMSFWGLGIVVAPMLGPVLGGWLTDNYSWRWVFYINVPIGIIALLMTHRFIFDPPYIRRSRHGIDYWGIGLLAVGIGALQIVLDKGQQEDWFQSDFIVTLSIICSGGLVLFLIHAFLAKHPVLDLGVFRKRTYSVGVFLSTMLGFVLFGSLVLVPIWIQTLMGYPALQAGLTLAPRGLGSFVITPIVGVILSRVDPRKVLVVGLVGTSVTLFQLSALNLDAGYWDFFWPQFLQGVGLAMLFAPLTTITMDPIPNEEMGNATSILNLMRNIGGSVGIAAATTMVARNQQQNINLMGARVNAYNPQARATLEGVRDSLIAQGTDLTTATRQAYGMVFGFVQQQAAIVSFLNVFRLMGIIFLLVMPFVLLMKRPRGRRPGPAGR